MAEEIVNKVANSGLINIDLSDYYSKGKRMHLDIQPWLFQGLILKEKDFRQYLKDHDWSQYQDAYVSVNCSADAIIPQWAYMLIGTQLQDFAAKVCIGNSEVLEGQIMEENISKIDMSQYQDKRVIIKGCGDLPIPSQAYLSFAAKLKPFAKSIMFGEACSMVPIFKNKS
tara:strand:+ start:99 stop:608 length:510 start_codon:yes stop_codon:yes gene_type:complete